jgi:hypothetical protein
MKWMKNQTKERQNLKLKKKESQYELKIDKWNLICDEFECEI